MRLQRLVCLYLVHGVFGDDLDCPQGSLQVHEHDGNRPEGNDCQDADKWVDPYCSSGYTQLKHIIFLILENCLSSNSTKSE